MNPASEDIKDIIESETSLGLVFQTNLFIGKEPTKPDQCVTIFDTYGGAPASTLKNDSQYYYPSILIRVRSKSYKDGWSLMDDIKVLLHGRGPETWNGTLYTVIRCLNDPGLFDWDENNRARFICNFEIQRR